MPQLMVEVILHIVKCSSVVLTTHSVDVFRNTFIQTEGKEVGTLMSGAFNYLKTLDWNFTQTSQETNNLS